MKNTPTKQRLVDLIGLDAIENCASIEEPTEIEGWCDTETLADEIRRYAPKIAVEIGTWKGRSACAIAEAMPEDSCLICIDTFTGSFEHWITPEYREQLKEGLLNAFRRNVAARNLQHKIIALPLPSDLALRILAHYQIKVDLFWVDGSHEENQVKRDLMNAFRLLAPGGTLLGDDLDWDSVSSAVLTCAATLEGCSLISKPLANFTTFGDNGRCYKFSTK